MQLIVAVLLGVSLLVPTASFAAEKVVVMVRTGVEADAIRAVAQAYTKASGRPVEMMEIGRSATTPRCTRNWWPGPMLSTWLRPMT